VIDRAFNNIPDRNLLVCHSNSSLVPNAACESIKLTNEGLATRVFTANSNIWTSSDILRAENRLHMLRIFSSSANVHTRRTQSEPTGVNRTCHPVGNRWKRMST